MKEILRKRMIPIVSLIGLTIVLVLIYKTIFGTNIIHESQYFYKTQGNINVLYGGLNNSVKLRFIDSKVISEFSSENNIEEIILLSTTNEEVLIEDWKITRAYDSFDDPELNHKEITLIGNFNKSVVISKLKIKFIDNVNEIYDIGDLNITVLDVTNNFALTQIKTYFKVFNSESVEEALGKDTDFIVFSPSMMHIDAQFYKSTGFRINDINLKISGLGYDLSTLQVVETSFYQTDYSAFSNNEVNEEYISRKEVKTISNSELNLNGIINEDTGTIDFSFIIALQNTDEFNNGLVATYYNPVFSCFDVETDTTFLFGDHSTLNIYYPLVRNDSYAEQLLGEYGQ